METANRSVLRSQDAAKTQCNRAVQQGSAGDVILLKGEAFRGNVGRGAVRRSPPIKAQGLSRLVLKVDEGRCGC